MPTPHSSVNYVEPNFSSVKGEFSGGTFQNWALEDDFERAPRLEDYSIMLNLEVEVCSRKNISKNKTVTKDVLILQYSSRENGKKTAVNFMGGTKIQCNDTENHYINFLTNNYADMYVGDLIHYGTTEMIGVKSVDIEYQKSCVPVINIKFTDVRGLSLFQPTELSRTNAYQGIGGINADNVAQSFFQCFFRVPMPKFTITIKGFYGKPVTYEVLCDKFETSFNSDTGDFDIDTRFIGYSYSFLTDIVMDALLAAPYSDYGGRVEGGDYNKYWKQEIDSGRFTILNKEKTARDNMPTLYEIYRNVTLCLKEITGVTSIVSEEEKTHAEEIETLTSLKDRYALWYSTLYNICVNRYGKEFVYLFENEGCNYRLLILTNRQTVTQENLTYAYEHFTDEFKEIHKDLNAAISEYNSKTYAFKKIENISADFSSFKRINLFNPLFVNGQNQIVFNGFHKSCNLPQTDVFSKVFMGVEYSGETAEQDAEQHKKHVLSTIYNDGSFQYIDCYSIDVDYSFIETRIKALQADANRNPQEREDERRRKAINKELFKQLKWYPSVENFTRIMMAHLETLMKQMYDCVSACEGRKASELGVNPSENLDVPNATKDPEIPPFPRVFRHVVNDDQIVNNEDTWVGEFKGSKPFAEVDFINGLFNGAERVVAMYKAAQEVMEESQRQISVEASDTPIIKHPLTSLDFYINKPPYGASSDVSADESGYDFAGRVAFRMFSILCINNFRLEFGNKFFGLNNPELVGRIEADNFYNTTKITNDRFFMMIRNGIITEENIIKYITDKKPEAPWGGKPLFSRNRNGKLWLDAYRVEKVINNQAYVNNIYPIQNINYGNLRTAFSNLNQGKITNSEGDISLWNIPNNVMDKTANNHDNYGYGTTLIVEDISIIESQLDNANVDADSGYTEIYNEISSASSYDSASSYFGNAAFSDSFFIRIGNDHQELNSPDSIEYSKFNGDKISIKIKGIENLVEYSNSNGSTFGFADEIKNGNINTISLIQSFGYKNENGKLEIDRNKNIQRQLAANYDKISGITIGGINLNRTGMKMTLTLMGILIRYNDIGGYLNKNNTFTYIPKIVVLQIGAIIFASGGIHKNGNSNDIRNAASQYIPVGNSEDYPDTVFQYIASLSKLAKHQYEKYYIDWLNSHFSEAENLWKYSKSSFVQKGNDKNRIIFNEANEYVKNITNDLLKAVCVVRLTVNHIKQTRDNYLLDEGTAINYLKGFIERLKELYSIDHAEDENGNIIKTTDEPHKTTQDMKKELYRYMKQLYDKWIPMSSFEDWKLDAFFINKGNGDKMKDSEDIGHKFYFIDSYYNDISNKLIINPIVISEKVKALLSYQDINSMLLGFMADMYSANKSMFMSIQNFADLRKKGSMDEMFTPISYNSINWGGINKYPSFVVVYPYQASRNLNIPNGEYENDGFMLNDEFETPIAVRSKNDENGYRIPAFGVSYGKQYQSYFKKVNIDMKSPIATEQSIRAKHAILIGATSSGEKGIKAQDLYDVYASQSYTCNVEMMGCAWVQPLMYFVLLNVPMFRGSYMIMKVKHSIRPGTMTTTFTGCRMANVSNTIIEDIFTDGDVDDVNMSYNEFESQKQLKADIDNDCPYKIYPLYEDNSPLTGTDAEKGIQTMNKLIGKGFNQVAAAGIAGNIMQECRFDHTICVVDSDGYLAGGICGWNDRYGNLSNLCRNNRETFGQKPVIRNFETNSEGIKKAKAKLAELGFDYQLDFMIGTLGKVSPKLSVTIMNNCSSPESAAEKFRASYEKGTRGKREKFARDIYEAYVKSGGNSQKIEEKTDKEKKDINDALFDAVKKSAQSTPSISVELEKGKSNNYYVITQMDKKTDKLGIVFDMILNSEYYNYVQKLYWIYPTNGLNGDPAHIGYIAAESPKQTEKIVRVAERGKIGVTENNVIPEDASEKLLRSLAKYRAKVGDKNITKDVPQIKDLAILDKFKPKDCNTLVSTSNGGSSSGSLEGYNGDVKPGTKLYTLLDVANNGNALDYMQSHDYPRLYSEKYGNGTKPPYLNGYGWKIFKNTYCGCCTSGPTTWYKRIGVNLTWWNPKGVATSNYATTRNGFKNNGFNMVWHGHLSDAEKLPNSSFCPGDVATFHVVNGKGDSTSHGAMWTGKDWRSDCIQRALSCYPGGSDRDGNYSVCIWRMPSLVSEGLGINNTPDLT